MEQSPELRDIFVGWFKAVESGDGAWLERHISRQPGTRLIGTDPNEWLDGEQVAAFLKTELEAIGGQIQVVPGDVEAYREGSVGWGVIRPTMTLPNGVDFSPRWSAVFHQEDGQWKLVQVHASLGIANEEALGMELPS